jgi:hypothetical protein
MLQLSSFARHPQVPPKLSNQNLALVPKERVYDPTTCGRSDVLTRNLGLCDSKTNQHVMIFPSDSSITLLPTTADHFTHTSLTLVQDQQTLIIKSELTLSFIKGPESTDILATRQYITRQTHLGSNASQLILRISVNCPAKSLAQ